MKQVTLLKIIFSIAFILSQQLFARANSNQKVSGYGFNGLNNYFEINGWGK